MVKTKPPKKQKTEYAASAERLAHDDVDPLASPDLLWGMPVKTDTDLATYWTWRTLCNRYAVTRVLSKYSDDHRFAASYTERVSMFMPRDMAHLDLPKSKVYDKPIELDAYRRPKDYKMLYRALEVCLEHHRRATDNPTAESYIGPMVAHAADNGLDSLPSSVAAVRAGKPRDGGSRSDKAPRPPRSTVGRDQFGAKLGTARAAAGAVLSDKWKTMDQIMKEANIDRPVRNYFKHLAAEGIIEIDGKKYRLKK